MLWRTLWSRIGKQPLTVTNHEHVKAVIDGKTIFLDLKYDSRERPYLIQAPERTRDCKFKPGTKAYNKNNYQTVTITRTTPDPNLVFTQQAGQPEVLTPIKHLTNCESDQKNKP